MKAMSVPVLTLIKGDRLWTPILTGLALIAFAANSVLCRLALGQEAIDAASFTTIRLVSGALTLLLVATLSKGKEHSAPKGSWTSATVLFLYAISFSFAYVTLSTATGALILFPTVQFTMVAAALYWGERPHSLEWVGLSIALCGLVYLMLPGLVAPSPIGSFLMTLAGIGWGVYSLRGRDAIDPIAVNRDNFVRSVPMVLGVSLMLFKMIEVSPQGALLAVASGSLASGVGYVIWYAALRGLTTTRAATLQLSVPVLAALGGIVFLNEQISTRLIISSVAILGGLGLVVLGRGFSNLALGRGVGWKT